MSTSTTTFKLLLASGGAAGVTNSLGQVTGALGGMLSAALSVTAAIGGVKDALNFGSSLQHLSLRTGQTIKDLVLLDRAFDATGIGSENSAVLVGYLQKAISGVGEEAKNKGAMLKEMGLSPEFLRTLSAPEQFEAFGASFRQIENPAQRTALAMKLFEESGAKMLQLFRAPTTFSDAVNDVGLLGDRMERNAPVFEDAETRLSLINYRLKEMWVVSVEQLLPALIATADIIKGMDLAPIGAALPSVVGVLGAVAGYAVIRKLDFMLLDWATKSGPVMGQRLAGGLAPMSGALAKVLPIGLAAAVALAVAKGIYSGWAEGQKQILSAADAKFDAVGNVQNAAAGIRTEADRQKVLRDIYATQTQINEALAQEESHLIKTDARQRAIASYKQQLEQLYSLIRLLNTEWSANQIAQNQAADASSIRSQRETESLTFLQSAEAEKMRDKLASAEQEKLALDERIDLGQFEIDLLTYNIAEEKIKLEAAGQINAAKAFTLKMDAELLDKAAKLAALEKQRATEHLASAQKSLETQLLELGEKRADLEGDFARRESDKFAERRRLLQEEIALQESFLDNLNQLRAATTDPDARATYDSAAQGTINRLSGLRGQEAQQGADPNSFREQSLSQLTDVENSLRTVQQNVAGVFSDGIRASIDQARQGLQLLIGDTQFWSQKLGNIAGPVMGAVTGAVARLFTDWVAGRALAYAKSLIFGKTEAISSIGIATGTAAALSLIWAAPATLATIATLGGAAAGAPVAISLAKAATIATSAVPGFSEGGYTGDTGGIVHPHEVVFSAPAVETLGRDNLLALHSSAKAGNSSPAPSGASGVGGGAQNIAVFYDESAARRWLEGREGSKHLIRQVGDARGDMGIPT